MKLHVLLTGIAAALFFTLTGAEWQVDPRCANHPASGVRRRETFENSAPETDWQHDSTIKHSPASYPKRNLRGSAVASRQLQDGLVEVFRLKMFWREGYCVSDTQ